MSVSVGPWEMRNETSQHLGHRWFVTSESTCIAWVWSTAEDAQLISAAPELLKVARLAQDVLSAQAAYFRDRTTEALIYSRRREAELRRECLRVLRLVEVGP